MTSRILLAPRRPFARNNSPSSAKMLKATLLNSGYRAVCLERDQVLDELSDDVAAVFIEIFQEADLAFITALRARTQKPMLVYGESVPESVQLESLARGADVFLCVSDALAVVEARVSAFLRRAG